MKCSRCDGLGRLICDNPHGAQYGVPCPDCKGAGDITDCPTQGVCPHCRMGWGHLTDGVYVATRESQAAVSHEHDWIDRGTDGDRWRECWLCSAQEDVR